VALALGRTVAEIEDGMSIREFDGWRQFVMTHPLPADLIDTHLSRLLATLGNVNRPAGVEAFDWRDYLLVRDPAPAPPEPAKPQLTMAQRWMAAVNTPQQRRH
jgi:hypothetical protein